MASGVGSRFGGDKLMATLDGRPIISYVIQATEGLFEERVVVTRSEQVAELCHAAGVRVILHAEPHRNDTVRLGMELMRDCDTVTFMQGDQPLISPESIRLLLQHAQTDPSSIWRAGHQGMPGAPVLFPAWTFEELCALPQSKGGGYVAKARKDCVRMVEVADRWELFDVDTREDLQVLEKHVSTA